MKIRFYLDSETGEPHAASTNTATATTAVVPSGFAFVSPTTGALQINASNGSITNQNFGLFHGSLVSGAVFKAVSAPHFG